MDTGLKLIMNIPTVGIEYTAVHPLVRSHRTRPHRHVAIGLLTAT